MPLSTWSYPSSSSSYLGSGYAPVHLVLSLPLLFLPGYAPVHLVLPLLLTGYAPVHLVLPLVLLPPGLMVEPLQDVLEADHAAKSLIKNSTSPTWSPESGKR